MERIILQYWDDYHALWCIQSDKKIGFYKKKDPNEKIKISGFIKQIKNDYFALFINEGELFFKINELEWNSNNPNLSVHYKRVFFFEFLKVKEKGKIIFYRKYNSYCAFIQTFRDVTFDRIDEDKVYFLQWCFNLLKNPERIKNTIREWNNWHSGNT
jgi:hypothetical protein